MLDLIMSDSKASASQLPGQARIRQVIPWLFSSSLFEVLISFALFYIIMGPKTT